MASSSQPYSREDWNNLLTEINDKLDEEGCDDIDRLPLVDPSHRWEKEDINEARRVMQESCEDIAFSAEVEKWTVDVVQEIEDQITDMGCDCESEMPECANAAGSEISDLTEVTPTACTEVPTSTNATIRQAVGDKNVEYVAAIGVYTSRFQDRCDAKQTLDALLASSDPDAGELAAAQAAYDAADGQVSASLAAMSAIAAESVSLASSAVLSGYSSYIPLVPGGSPWPDQDECYYCPNSSPSRCRVLWSVQARTISGSFTSSWASEANGSYTHDGAVQVSRMFQDLTVIPAFKCYSTDCSNGCISSPNTTFEFRLVIQYPVPSGPVVC